MRITYLRACEILSAYAYGGHILHMYYASADLRDITHCATPGSTPAIRSKPNDQQTLSFPTD
ncbi:hypothetical protein [Streptomyces luteolus]|uniref:Uncharacterized protein n=1 Tax=Streptomyces luteolus TaxID=3043615 RepID=A0ABT6T659_9ACTN|nr:hypothetical protein [Streptomyces sp. B-S-A12]MDI3423366.1 hypothetical protein [Streptomyces sp. B-S-A12]